MHFNLIFHCWSTEKNQFKSKLKLQTQLTVLSFFGKHLQTSRLIIQCGQHHDISAGKFVRSHNSSLAIDPIQESSEDTHEGGGWKSVDNAFTSSIQENALHTRNNNATFGK